MPTDITKSAPTVEEAVDAALEELGVQADAADFEVLESGAGGATVRVTLKAGHEPDAELEEDDASESEGNVAEPAAPELTEEELDKIADTAVASIQSVLAAFGISATIDEYEGDEGEIILDIVGGDLAILIGRHGKTLDALQTLVAAITSRQIGHRFPVVVDVEGYRARRREKLEDVARRTADRVARQGRGVKLRPMTSYERRIVHMTLRDDRRVVTGSEGEEPTRSVVVSPK